MEVDREANSPVQLYSGFTQSESERLLKKVKATFEDLAQNAKSRKVREEAMKELRDRGWVSQEPKPEPVELKDKTLSPPDSIKLLPEQIEYIRRVALEAGEDFGDL